MLASTPVLRRPRTAILAAVLAVAAIAFVLFWFQPQKLLIDERVEAAVPTVSSLPGDASLPPTSPPTTGAAVGEDPVSTTVSTAPPAAPAPPPPVDLRTGTFVSRDHGTTGTVRLLQLEDGSRYVRLEGLATDNGPDLYLYLSTNPADGPEGAFDDGSVNLGRLQGNQGDQNYLVPPDVDLDAFASVVIWCDRFDSAFGAADLRAR